MSKGWEPENKAIDEPLWCRNNRLGMRNKWLYIRKMPIDSIDWDAINSK